VVCAPRIFAMSRFAASQHVQCDLPAVSARLIMGGAHISCIFARILPASRMSTTTPPQSPPSPALSFKTALYAMLGIGLVNMLVALDQTVVSTALPSIVAELHGFEFYAWIASAYLLASVVTVPVFGRLGDYFGRKRFVIAAVITFTIASVLCGLAPACAGRWCWRRRMASARRRGRRWAAG
jgi:hypothetical protein